MVADDDNQPCPLVCASPSSPLAPRTLLPPTPQSEIVTAPETIIQELRRRFHYHLLRGHDCKEFLQRKGIENAWKTLFRVHGLENPIPLDLHSAENQTDQRPAYWLVFCKCGDWAEIGQALKKDQRVCFKCRNEKRKDERRHIQIEKKRNELAHPSSRAPYSSLATPVKVERYKNVRKLLNTEKRRYAHLKNVLSENHAKTLDSSDKKATELVSAALRFFADNSEHMVDLFKNIVVQGVKSGSIKNSESDITNFAEHCVTTIQNFTKVANGQEKQIRFTPLSLRAALSLWMRSKKGYAVHRALVSVEIMPSQSSLK